MTRVVIAEDDPDTAAAIRLTLEERLSVTTAVVTNGALVLDELTATRPDLLILDVSLPGLNGVDVFDLIRGNARCGDQDTQNQQQYRHTPTPRPTPRFAARPAAMVTK